MTRRIGRAALAVLVLGGLALAALALTGCLAEPKGPDIPPMCETTADCDSGEVCDQGVCWGNPPDGPFAAVLAPPAERTDLVATEVPELAISSDGNVPGLVFAETVTISGRVVIDCPDQVSTTDCDPDRSIAAQIRVRRPSEIAGAPDYTRTINATGGAGDGELGFTLLLPRLDGGATPYEITVVPDATPDPDGAMLPPAAIAPPVRFTVAGDHDEIGVDWVLGDPDTHKWVSGRILDAAGRGLAQMQVYALGTWAEDGEPERGSTLVTTDAEGAFSLRIPLAMLDVYEIVAKPTAGVVRPTLHVTGVAIEDPADVSLPVAIGDLRMPSYPDATHFILPLTGTDSGGASVSVSGAEVSMTTILIGGLGVTAVFTATGSSDVDGNADLMLIPGGSVNREYLAQVRSDPSSEYASIVAQPIAVGPGNSGAGYLGALVLPRRVFTSGTLYDDAGNPVAGAQVVATPSPVFAWSLPLDVQAFLANLQPPSTTTNEHGDFLLWLDPQVTGITARYDLAVTPPPNTGAPPWTVEAIDADLTGPEALLGRRLGDVQLPPAAYARGTVVSSLGEPIAGATVWVLEVRSDDTICANAIRPGNDPCVPPAIPRGLWRSRDDGQVWLALPDPH